MTRSCAVVLALCLLGGCEPTPTTQAPPLERPSTITPSTTTPTAAPPAADERKSPPAAPTPAIARADGRVVVTTAALVEELVLVPHGVVWSEDGEVRAAFADDATPRVLATVRDPHALVTDGRAVYWLGDEDNGRYDLATAKVSAFPAVAGPGEQEELAAGELLYARSRPDALWSIDLSGASSVRRLPFHPDAKWQLLPGFAAAKRTLFVPVRQRARGGASGLLRFDVAGKTTVIPLSRPLRRHAWSVDAKGDVVLVDAAGTVARIASRDRKPVAMFEQPDVEKVCWCGAEVCTFTAEGRIERRARGESSGRLVTDDAGAATSIACERDRIAWTLPLEPAGARTTVLDLR